MAWVVDRDDAFDRSLKTHCKKLASAEQDVLDAFKNGPPQFKDPLVGFRRKLWKARVASSDLKKGKSGGLRVIFYWDEDLPNWCCLGSCYPKGERENLKSQELDRLLISFKARLGSVAKVLSESETSNQAE